LSRVLITGIGVVSAIGFSADENHTALKNGACGIDLPMHLQSKYAGIFPAGEIKITTEDLKRKLGIKDASVTRTTAFAVHAFAEACSDAGLTGEQLASGRTALIGATTVGGMCLTDELYRDANSDFSTSPFLSSYDCSSVFLYLQQHYKIGGLVDTINTACSSSANAISYGARLIKLGFADRAIVGGAESLSKFTVNGFNALHILSTEICRPFDAARQGLNLGEGAAFLVLEKEENIGDKKLYAEVKGYGNASDAFHSSSLSDEGHGPFAAMQEALASAGLAANDIDFINAHGTATENNDEVEGRAILRVFGKPPLFASTKSNTGHTLGASGAIEAVYSIFNIINQEIYPTLNFANVDENIGFVPVTNYRKLKVQNVMSNSFGFGGNCTSLIFSKAW